MLFFKRYNKLNDGLLKYSEFINAIAPIDQQQKKLLIDKKPNINSRKKT